MNRKLTLSLSILQSLGLFAADFTLAELEKMMDTFELKEGKPPSQIQQERINYMASFHIKTEKEYILFREKALSGYYNNIHKDEGGKKALQALHNREERLKRLEEDAKIFQTLTESTTVMRRDKLDELLKQAADRRNRNAVSFSSPLGYSHMLIRMAATEAHPEVWIPLECPKCHTRFYVLNGTNTPDMAPLGSIFCLFSRFDLQPDYSTLCPSCHSDADTPRLLDVTFTIDNVTHTASLSPADLKLLHRCFMGTPFLNADRQPQKPVLTPAQFLRLRSIIQGTVKETTPSKAE